MRALVLAGPESLALTSLETPSPTSAELLVAVDRVGLCGTDIKIWYGAIAVSYPLVLGHEFIGRVAESSDAAFPEGTRVLVDPNTACLRCYHCRIGQQQLCPSGQLIGRDRNGALAEFVVVPVRNTFVLPGEIADDEGPALQVLSTVIHAHRLVPIFPSQSVAVFGLGVAGQLHVQVAKARGAYPVIGVSRSPAKRELALSLGADVVLGTDELAKINDATEGRGADVTIEAVGKASVVADAIGATRVGGTLLGFGIGTESAAPVQLYELYRKELAWISSRGTKGEDFPVAIDMVRRGAVRLNDLISELVELGGVDAALRRMSASSDVMKVVVAP